MAYCIRVNSPAWGAKEVEAGTDYRVTLVEKAPGLGQHTLSGAVLEPRALSACATQISSPRPG